MDSQSSGFWSFMLGIFFAIAFCPHRLVYFFTMVDLAISLPMGWNWLLPMVFGIGTGLPIMIIAWLIAYSVVPMAKVKEKLHHIEKWVRYVSAVLFIGFGIYLSVHLLVHGHDCGCEHPHYEVIG